MPTQKNGRAALKELENEVLAEGRARMRRRLAPRLAEQAREAGAVSPPSSNGSNGP